MSWHAGGPLGDPHAGPGYSGRNRQSAQGGPSGVQRSSAIQLKENEPLFNTYEHLDGLPRGDAALHMLRKVASMVKPIMRKRGWRVHVLAEFLPQEQNLLGLNINKGSKICIRLRYHNNPDLFLSLNQVIDTMLHELSHNVWGDHNSNFHKLWDELRDEYEALVRKGYTGEGFLSEGKRLGGSGRYRAPPPHEMRRLARASAEKRKAQGTLNQGSGQRLGGMPLHQGRDVRQVIADQATRRNAINKGCGHGRKDVEKLSQDSANNTFKTKAEEDDANNRAIAQALYELMEEEEQQKLNEFDVGPSTRSSGLAWTAEHGLHSAGMSMPGTNDRSNQPSEEEQIQWAMGESVQSMGGKSVLKPLLPDTTSTDLERTVSAPPIPLDSKPLPPDSKFEVKRKQSRRPSSSDLADPSDIQTSADVRQSAKTKAHSPIDLTSSPEAAIDQWACEVCTCINPLEYLACDACGIERPQSIIAKTKRQSTKTPTRGTKTEPRRTTTGSVRDIPAPKQKTSLGWNCSRCGAFMEHKWWTCSACGNMKESS